MNRNIQLKNSKNKILERKMNRDPTSCILAIINIKRSNITVAGVVKRMKKNFNEIIAKLYINLQIQEAK